MYRKGVHDDLTRRYCFYRGYAGKPVSGRGDSFQLFLDNLYHYTKAADITAMRQCLLVLMNLLSLASISVSIVNTEYQSQGPCRG